MNQHQRRFLLEELEKQYRKEREALDGKRPVAPSLNNYLVAAILDGSARLRPQPEVEAAVKKRVRDLGKDDAFISRGSGRWAGHRVDSTEDHVSLPALLLFEPPPAYAEKLAEYETALAGWQARMQALDAALAAMRIKVQVGSDKALDALVEQADRLCAMSLTDSSRLLISDGAKEGGR